MRMTKVVFAVVAIVPLALACDNQRAGDDDTGDTEAEVDGAGDVDDLDDGGELESETEAEAPSCPDGMVYIPPGPFVMGSNPGDGRVDEMPKHTVVLSAYCIDVTEVTNAAWRTCVEAGGCSRPPWNSSITRTRYYNDPAYDHYPVIGVNFEQVVAFCSWAGRRLPSEAEWEKAARGGCEVVPPDACGPEDMQDYPWGDETPTCDRANFNGCVGDTDQVGTRPAGDSPYGVHDMGGNVWEWVADWYDASYYGGCADGCVDPPGPPVGTMRIARGGDWYHDLIYTRVATRGQGDPTLRDAGTGLRCAWSP